MNPTRTAFLAVLERMGAERRRRERRRGRRRGAGHRDGAPSDAQGDRDLPPEIPGLIDELPALAALATHGGGLTVSGAGELRLKESDRITALVAGLRALGADVDERPTASASPAAGPSRAASPTRPAIIGWRWPSPSPRSGARGDSRICGAEAVAISYPASSTRSRASASEGGQDLPGRVHGRRQDLARPRGRAPARLEGRGRRRAHRGARAPARCGDISPPTASRTSAPSNARWCSDLAAAPPRGGRHRRRDVRRSRHCAR